MTLDGLRGPMLSRAPYPQNVFLLVFPDNIHAIGSIQSFVLDLNSEIVSKHVRIITISFLCNKAI